MAEILELAPTFRSLADAYAATPSAVGGALEKNGNGGGGAAETEGGAVFSRLGVGLAVRQVRAELSFFSLGCSSAWHNHRFIVATVIMPQPIVGSTRKIALQGSKKENVLYLYHSGTICAGVCLDLLRYMFSSLLSSISSPRPDIRCPPIGCILKFFFLGRKPVHRRATLPRATREG